MIEHVYRPSRLVDGKRVKARVYLGRFRLTGEVKIRTVSLDTTDRRIAEKRLREKVLELEREREGMIQPRAMRETATRPLESLIAEYQADLTAQGRDARHVHDTTTRIRRMVDGTGWQSLNEVRADEFIQWRAGLTCSAKTKKEYQVSACAFFNWLKNTRRIEENPLVGVTPVETRGKQVREPRSLSAEELKNLLGVSGRRALAYQMLLYTGQRKEEVRALTWGDLSLDEGCPSALFREGTTKDKEKRAVPLRRELAAALGELKPANAKATDRVFFGWFPRYSSLRRDLERAGIEHRDALGRVVHFHSFRKTFQTLGVRAGINQRSAQEILGHSDPSLTARVYTDVPALALAEEVAKLPWIGPKKYSQMYSQRLVAGGRAKTSTVLGVKVLHDAQATEDEEIGRDLSAAVTPCQVPEMVGDTGLEQSARSYKILFLS